MRTINFKTAGVKFTYLFSPLAFHFYSFKIHQGFSYLIKPSFLYGSTVVHQQQNPLFLSHSKTNKNMQRKTGKITHSMNSLISFLSKSAKPLYFFYYIEIGQNWPEKGNVKWIWQLYRSEIALEIHIGREGHRRSACFLCQRSFDWWSWRLSNKWLDQLYQII